MNFHRFTSSGAWHAGQMSMAQLCPETGATRQPSLFRFRLFFGKRTRAVFVVRPVVCAVLHRATSQENRPVTNVFKIGVADSSISRHSSLVIAAVPQLMGAAWRHDLWPCD